MKRFLLALLLVFPLAASAEFLDGNQLYAKMGSTTEADRVVAGYYIGGVHDAVRGILVCDPNNVNMQQIFDLTFAVLRDHPEIRQLTADSIVIRVLAQTFPCKKQPTSAETPKL